MSVNLNPHRKIPEWEAKLWVLEARYGSIVKAPDDDADYLAMRKRWLRCFRLIVVVDFGQHRLKFAR